jgi:hypothetical protein
VIHGVTTTTAWPLGLRSSWCERAKFSENWKIGARANQALIPNGIALRYEVHDAQSTLEIITRCTELQLIFNQLGRGASFGNSTTHMAKLLPRLDGGSGGGCPAVVFGIRGTCYVED